MFIFGGGIRSTKAHPLTALKIFMFFFVGGSGRARPPLDWRLTVACTAGYCSSWIGCYRMRADFRSASTTGSWALKENGEVVG